MEPAQTRTESKTEKEQAGILVGRAKSPDQRMLPKSAGLGHWPVLPCSGIICTPSTGCKFLQGKKGSSLSLYLLLPVMLIIIPGTERWSVESFADL